jgi:hypothetical protein
MPTLALLKDILWTIGGPESPAGTAASRTHVIPVRDNPGLDSNVERALDPVLAGGRMPVQEYPTKIDVSGALPLSPRVGGGWGKLIKSNLGLESTPAQLGAVVRIRYAGGSASCKITADTSGDTLTSEVGVLGSESGDAAFGTAGVIDLTAGAFDTVAELVAVIDAYANYEAELLSGSGAISSAAIVSRVTQAKGRWCYLFFTSGASGAYLRGFTADLTAASHPTYSIQREGYVSTGTLFNGAVADALKISGSLGAFIESDVDVLGFTEDDPVSASGLSVDDLDPGDPLLYWKGATEFDGVDYDFVSTHEINFPNNHNKDTFGQGSIGRVYHQKADLMPAGSLQVRLDSDTVAIRAKLQTASLASASFIYKGKAIGGSVEELVIVELPFIGISSPFAFTPRNGALDARVNWKAYNPRGTKYDVPVTIWMVSVDSGAF